MFVGDIPEGNAGEDGMGMAGIGAEDREELFVLFCLEGFQFWGIVIAFVGAAGASVLFPWVDGDIEFGDLYVETQRREAVDGGL